MKRSEIFDNFVKIAQEKGMISNESDSNDSSKSKKILEETGRADSLDISAIEALYGVKPDAPKDMEYERNIMENAHPNSVVVSPSYDKLNGLVENNNERQNILLHIVNKTPDGLSTQRKYAEAQLTLSLIRVANQLDSYNQDKLRILADNCLLQLAGNKARKSLRKEAAIPLLVLIPGALAALYVHQHVSNANRGLEQNYTKLIGELDDFLNDNNNGIGIKGHEYSQELLTDVRDFKTRLEEFYKVYTQLSGVLRELERPKDAKELIEISQRPKTATVINAVNKMRQLVTNMSSFIDIIQRNFSSDAYKARHVKSKGVVDSVLETKLFGVSLMGGSTGLIADDFQDVVNAIGPFKASIAELLKVMEDSKSIEDKSASDLSVAQAKAKEDFGGGMADLSPMPPQNNPSSGKSIADVEKESGELSKELSKMLG